MVDYPFDAFPLCQLEQREKVRPVAVHAAGAEQAKQVQGRAALQYVIASAHQLGVLEEGAVLDRFIQARKLLVDHEARAHILVAHFRVAHLAVWKPNSVLGGVE